MPSRRRADAARNDELFLDAGLELLRERGPDRIAALELARSAGLTTGAVYARYENPAEIMVGLWQNRISTPMRMFLENSLEALIDDSDTARASVTRALANPSGPLRPGASILLASTRFPQLAEVVHPDMQQWAVELGLTDDDTVERTIRSFLTSSALGMLLFATADLFHPTDWNFLQLWAKRSHSDRSAGRFPLPTPRPMPDATIESGDPNRDAIVNGAARIIVNGGFELATTQRIARASGLTPSDLFALYRTRSELFADVAQSLLPHVFGQARTLMPPPQPQNAATPWQENFLTERLANFRWLLGSEATQQRKLRVEFCLAALHDDVIARAFRSVDDNANDESADRIESEAGIDRETALRGVRNLRAQDFGSFLLQEVLGGFADLDLRYVHEPLVSILEEAIVKSPT